MTPVIRSLAALALLAAGCGAGDAAFPPADLAGLPRVGLLEGEAAREAVSRLHRNPEVAPEATWLAEYATPGTPVLLYVSRFGSSEEAAGALGAMLEGIRRGGTPFTAPVGRPDGTWSMEGLGQAHLVWVSGTDLFWLQAPRDVLKAAFEALEEHHPTAAVPVPAH